VGGIRILSPKEFCCLRIYGRYWESVDKGVLLLEDLWEVLGMSTKVQVKKDIPGFEVSGQLGALAAFPHSEGGPLVASYIGG
jgi:hypothetical protein